jgi:hypothetical protein
VPEAEVDALFREQLAWDSKFLSSMKYSGKVGAFEGAGYEAKGLYRPKRIASCSRAIPSASVACAAARLGASSTSTRGRRPRLN